MERNLLKVVGDYIQITNKYFFLKKQDVVTAIPKADTKRDEIHSINSSFSYTSSMFVLLSCKPVFTYFFDVSVHCGPDSANYLNRCFTFYISTSKSQSGSTCIFGLSMKWSLEDGFAECQVTKTFLHKETTI